MAADGTQRGRPEASTLTTPLVPALAAEHRSYGSSRPDTSRGGGFALDVLGVVLWLALVLWIVGAARTPADGAPLRDLLLLVAGAYVLARVVTVLQAWLMPFVLVLVGTLTAVWTVGGALSGGGGTLFGYANAAAAFHVACVTGGLMAVARLRTVPWFAGMPSLRPLEFRRVLVLVTVVCAMVPWVSTAATSALLVLVLPVTVISRELGWRVRRVVLGSALVALVVIGGTVAVAATFGGGGIADWLVSSTLSANRGQLWSEALDAAVANPVAGVGTGRFAQASATAGADTDLRWAHNAFLQLAAETGLPGAALALALLLWLFARMWAGGRDVATGVAAAGLAAMVVTAEIDYVWHFPGVALATATIAGSGTVRVARRVTTVRRGDAAHQAAVQPRQVDVTDQALGQQAGAHGARPDPDDIVWPRPLGTGGRSEDR